MKLCLGKKKVKLYLNTGEVIISSELENVSLEDAIDEFLSTTNKDVCMEVGDSEVFIRGDRINFVQVGNFPQPPGVYHYSRHGRFEQYQWGV